jgi:hypothetical protein
MTRTARHAFQFSSPYPSPTRNTLVVAPNIPSTEARITDKTTLAVYLGSPRQLAERLVPNLLWEGARRALDEVAGVRDFARFRHEKLERVERLHKELSGSWRYRFSNKHSVVFDWNATGGVAGPEGHGFATNLRILNFTKRA